jgi:hypothetical protein
MRNRHFLSVALISACGPFLIGSAPAQTEGTCYIDYFREGSPCVCQTGEGIETMSGEAAKICFPDDEDELARVAPNLPPEITPPEVTPPVVTPPGQTKVKRNNGIGNGVQDAPGNSDITNGDAADGSDSGRDGPAGAQDNTAANGDPADSGNNGNGNGNGKGNKS